MPRQLDFVEKQLIEKDICLLYHQQAEYGDIMGDLYWGTVYRLPYWEYVDATTAEPGGDEFIHIGSLIFVMAMAFQTLDDPNHDYIRDKWTACREAVSRLTAGTKDRARLIRIVLNTLDAVKDPDLYTNELSRDSIWVHRRFIREYFRSRGK